MNNEKPIEERFYLNEFHKQQCIKAMAAVKKMLENPLSIEEAKEVVGKITEGSKKIKK